MNEYSSPKYTKMFSHCICSIADIMCILTLPEYLKPSKMAANRNLFRPDAGNILFAVFAATSSTL